MVEAPIFSRRTRLVLLGDGLLRTPASGRRGLNKSWDGIWEVQVARDGRGWSAEFEIPFQTLNFDPRSDTWGINFQRTVRRIEEDSLCGRAMA